MIPSFLPHAFAVQICLKMSLPKWMGKACGISTLTKAAIWASMLVLDAIPLEDAQTRVKLIIDKSKNVPQIKEFNASVINQLLGRIDPPMAENTLDDLGELRSALLRSLPFAFPPLQARYWIAAGVVKI